MKKKVEKFTCHYLTGKGDRDLDAPVKKIEATSAEKAAHIFAERYPSENPKISIGRGLTAPHVVSNPMRREWEQKIGRAHV